MRDLPAPCSSVTRSAGWRLSAAPTMLSARARGALRSARCFRNRLAPALGPSDGAPLLALSLASRHEVAARRDHVGLVAGCARTQPKSAAECSTRSCGCRSRRWHALAQTRSPRHVTSSRAARWCYAENDPVAPIKRMLQALNKLEFPDHQIHRLRRRGPRPAWPVDGSPRVDPARHCELVAIIDHSLVSAREGTVLPTQVGFDADVRWLLDAVAELTRYPPAWCRTTSRRPRPITSDDKADREHCVAPEADAGPLRYRVDDRCRRHGPRLRRV